MEIISKEDIIKKKISTYWFVKKYIKTKLIIFSTGKIYRPGNNIKENSKKKPSGHYGKNKLITENKILKIRKNVLILRLSNIVGKKNINNYRKITNLFFDDIRKNLYYNP